MGRILGGIVLLLLALLMLMGYLRADLPINPAVRVLTFIIAVLVPAISGGLLLRSWFSRRKGLRRRKDLLRRQTLQAEILKLAREKGGSLSALDVVTEFGIAREEADAALDSFAVEGAAEVDISESGMLIYTFNAIRLLSEQSSARNNQGG